MEHFRINFDELDTLDKLSAFFGLLSENEKNAFSYWYFGVLSANGGK